MTVSGKQPPTWATTQSKCGPCRTLASSKADTHWGRFYETIAAEIQTILQEFQLQVCKYRVLWLLSAIESKKFGLMDRAIFSAVLDSMLFLILEFKFLSQLLG
jgi:hypothetical protein